MKKFIVAALALIAVPYSMATQPGGCVWNAERGSCMIANDKPKQVTCDIRLQVTTNKNQKTTKLNNIVINANEAYHTPQFLAALDDKIEKAQIAARCK